jgi:hypothetical protein
MAMKIQNQKSNWIIDSREKIFILLILFVVWLLVGFFKLNIYNKDTNFLQTDGFLLFRTESALRFRYAEMVAENGKIPKIDYDIQHPEGLEVYKHLCLTPEIVIGKLYRFLPLKRIPFHIFGIFFMFFFSSLSIFPLFFLTRHFSGNNLGALIATVFYITGISSFYRTVTLGFVQEDFALPLIFTSLYFFLHSLDENRILWAVLSGFSLSISLTSWHFAQFYFLIFLIFIIFEFILRPDSALLIRNFSVIVGFNILAGIFNPMLRAKAFLFSPPMLVSYVILFVNLFDRLKVPRLKFQKIFLFVGLSLILVLITSPYISSHRQDYAHVYLSVFQRIKYFGTKPSLVETVREIPFDVKVLWHGEFESPQKKSMMVNFLGILIAASYGIFESIRRLFRRRISISEEGLLFLVLAFGGAYFLFQRMGVFLIFFLSVFVGRVIGKFSSRYFPLILLVLGLSFYYQISNTILFVDSSRRKIDSSREEIIQVIKKYTQPKSVILADIPISGEFLTYAKRPIVLHCLFESKHIRDKTKEFYSALFGEEDKFYSFCQKHKVDYIIYYWMLLLDKTKYSVRYLVDMLKVRKNSAAYLFHFEPEELKHFSLVYENVEYRVYKVRDTEERVKQPIFRQVSFFNKDFFLKRREGCVFFDDEFDDSGVAKVWTIQYIMNRAQAYEQKGKYEAALSAYKEVISIAPEVSQAYLELGNLLFSLGRVKEAIQIFEKALEVDPQNQSIRNVLRQIKIKDKGIQNH